MRTHAENRSHAGGRPYRPRLTDVEFRALMQEARAETRRRSLGDPPAAEADFALRTQHAEFGAGAH
ncbi:hypothetical protein HHL19_22785 [Streptomyces sp. R302]|uniref:hypothetical protein n=1 Tax=unclassified Streptomyces TaxID=2593676 RepID=UPI00145D6CF3|nr:MULTISPECIES: hypothetical protein [unclassified Streptomyces]NML51777.1 hypothetical protein [Streptomyces sp. R301]NML81397.1 hypothetical protein [Streptomyces sp. R302]